MKPTPEAIAATQRRAQEPIRRDATEALAEFKRQMWGGEVPPDVAHGSDLYGRRVTVQQPAVAFTVPLRTVPGLNARENPFVRAKRVKAERAAISRGLRKALGCDRWACSGVVSLPAVVTLTRVGPRPCDSDNLAGAMKAVRDSVAAFLGVDDGADWVEWRYRQERGEWGVRVEIAPADK